MNNDELRASLEVKSTDELVSILRNRNEDEWRPEVFELVASLLAARGISAAVVSAIGPEGEDVVEHQQLVSVGRYFSPAEAHAGRMALEGAGVKAWVVDESLGGVYGIGVGSRLQVRLEDKDAALSILDDVPIGAPQLPAELAEPPCPQCGAGGATLTAEPIEDPDVPRVRGGRRKRQWYFDCGACGHRWKDEVE
jgi:hypothetical protein